MSDQPQRRFTVLEANRTIPSLEQRLARIEELLQSLAGSAPAAADYRRGVSPDGGRLVPPSYLQGIEEVLAEQGRLEQRGIIVRDVRRGLVDFPAMLDGQEVYLCWLRGEERVGYYHEPGTGFAGRQPLPPDAE